MATFERSDWLIHPISGPAQLREVIAMAPRKPGVYVFLDATDTAIYIGKALRLRNRLGSYTRAGRLTESDHRPVTIGLFGWPRRQPRPDEDLGWPRKRTDDPLGWPQRQMGPDEANAEKAAPAIGQAGATAVGWRECSSESEALILEARLIRTLKPRLNIRLRDDKGYTYVGFSADACPRLFLVKAPSGRRPAPDPPRPGARYVGPFTDIRALERTLAALRRAFPYVVHRDRPARCLEYEIGLCPLPPGQPESELAPLCRRNARAIRAILSGQTAGLARTWRRQMRVAAANTDYEAAARRRDDLAALVRVSKAAKPRFVRVKPDRDLA